MNFLTLTKSSLFKSSFFVTFLFLAQVAAPSAWSAIPECLDSNGKAMSVDNATPLEWKTKEANQFLARSHIDGHFVKVSLERASHYQFIIQIGPDAKDLIEVIYNKEFGEYPAVFPGMKVEACGDFINSFAQAGRYPPSPAGAIIHWVHKNPKASQGSHPSGFLVMDGKLVGYSNPKQSR